MILSTADQSGSGSDFSQSTLEKMSKRYDLQYFLPRLHGKILGPIVLLVLLGTVVHQTKPKRAPPSPRRPFP